MSLSGVRKWGTAAALDPVHFLEVAQEAASAKERCSKGETVLGEVLVRVGPHAFPPRSPWKTPEELAAANTPVRECGGTSAQLKAVRAKQLERERKARKEANIARNAACLAAAKPPPPSPKVIDVWLH